MKVARPWLMLQNNSPTEPYPKTLTEKIDRSTSGLVTPLFVAQEKPQGGEKYRA